MRENTYGVSRTFIGVLSRPASMSAISDGVAKFRNTPWIPGTEVTEFCCCQRKLPKVSASTSCHAGIVLQNSDSSNE